MEDLRTLAERLHYARQYGTLEDVLKIVDQLIWDKAGRIITPQPDGLGADLRRGGRHTDRRDMAGVLGPDRCEAHMSLPTIKLDDGAELREREGFEGWGYWLYRDDPDIPIRQLNEFEERFVLCAFRAGTEFHPKNCSKNE